MSELQNALIGKFIAEFELAVMRARHGDDFTGKYSMDVHRKGLPEVSQSVLSSLKARLSGEWEVIPRYKESTDADGNALRLLVQMTAINKGWNHSKLTMQNRTNWIQKQSNEVQAAFSMLCFKSGYNITDEETRQVATQFKILASEGRDTEDWPGDWWGSLGDVLTLRAEDGGLLIQSVDHPVLFGGIISLDQIAELLGLGNRQRLDRKIKKEEIDLSMYGIECKEHETKTTYIVDDADLFRVKILEYRGGI